MAENGKQSYFCHDGNAPWSSKSRLSRKISRLWEQYALDGHTAQSLARQYGCSCSGITAQLNTFVPLRITQKSRTLVIIIDATYFVDCGLLAVIDPYANLSLGEYTVHGSKNVTQ